MSLNFTLSSTQNILEHLGTCGLASFFSEKNKKIGKVIQICARGTLALFATLTFYDLFVEPLPFKARILVHGTLLFTISCLVLSILFKAIISPPKIKEEIILDERKEIPKEQTTLKPEKETKLEAKIEGSITSLPIKKYEYVTTPEHDPKERRKRGLGKMKPVNLIDAFNQIDPKMSIYA